MLSKKADKLFVESQAPGKNGESRKEGDYQCVTLKDFAELFGASEDDFSPQCRKLIKELDFGYQLVSGKERDQIILEVLKKIESDQLSVSGEERKKDWEKGWLENLRRFTENDYDESSLIPAYIRPDKIIRFKKDYIKPSASTFELNFYTIYRYYLFEKYLTDFDPIYEFGCGTGYSLTIMAQLFPDKKLYGLDWAESSNELVNKIAKAHRYNLSGLHFDMFAPDENLEVPNNCAFITLNSLEQLGDKFETFLQYTLRKSPAICINSEPLVDLYDQNNLIDYLAIKYHQKRWYLGKYVTRLRTLEAAGKIEIIKTQRVAFGSFFHEAQSIVVWKPKKSKPGLSDKQS